MTRSRIVVALQWQPDVKRMLVFAAAVCPHELATDPRERFKIEFGRGLDLLTQQGHADGTLATW